MEIKDYASNSHKSKQMNAEANGEIEVVEGTKEIQMRKPSVGKKLMKTFIQEDFEDIKEAIIYDYIIPGIKECIRSVIDMALGGDGRPSSRSSSRNSYDKYYRDRDRRDRRDSRRHERDRRDDDLIDFSDIVYDSRLQAEDIRNDLMRDIRQYESLSISNFWDILRENHYRVSDRWRRYTDNEFGWYDIGSCHIDRVHEGWVMRIPKPISLNENDR